MSTTRKKFGTVLVGIIRNLIHLGLGLCGIIGIGMIIYQERKLSYQYYDALSSSSASSSSFVALSVSSAKSVYNDKKQDEYHPQRSIFFSKMKNKRTFIHTPLQQVSPQEHFMHGIQKKGNLSFVGRSYHHLQDMKKKKTKHDLMMMNRLPSFVMESMKAHKDNIIYDTNHDTFTKIFTTNDINHQDQHHGVSSTNDDENHHNTTNPRHHFDLIFWSDIPILSQPIDQQQRQQEEGYRFLVVYTTEKEDRLDNVFLEVFFADFRLCYKNKNDDSQNSYNNVTLPPCPDVLSFGHPVDLDQIYEYQRIKGQSYDIFVSIPLGTNDKSTEGKRSHPTLVFRPDLLQAVTLWSETYQQYFLIPFPSTLPTKQKSKTKHSQQGLPLKICHPLSDTMKSTCPQRCPKGSYLESSNGGKIDNRYPYLLDSFDKLCKSTHPEGSGRKRPFGGLCGCETTCFTPLAVSATISTTTPTSAVEKNLTTIATNNDTTSIVTRTNPWPWKNESERQQYAPYWNDPDQHREKIFLHNRRERTRREKLPAYWTYKPRFACDFNDTSRNDSSLQPTPEPPPIGGDFSFHLMFFPEAKMIFCGIPKVGITEWAKFLRFTIGAKDYVAIPHFKLDRMGFMLGNLEPSLAMEMLNDPTWTKAVIIRNPLERLVSAYQDKIVRKSYTQKVFKIGSMDQKKEDRYVLSFSEFVDKVTTPTDPITSSCSNPTGLSACTDPHWKPQLMMCGLDYLLPKFDFVGNFDYVAEHTKALLEKVGMWETWGRKFDDGSGTTRDSGSHICFAQPPKRGWNESVSGFNQQGLSVSGGKYVHSTGSKNKMDEFYTPELIEKVRKAYYLDFMVWDEMSKKSADEEISHGKDLKVVQEYCSSVPTPQ